jgi:hypothetical protein
MLVSDRYIFIDLPKCASSHIQRCLLSLLGGQRKGTHVPASSGQIASGRPVWSSIRNPWDWYLSLWAYGCDGKGALYQALTTDMGWLRSRGWKQSIGSGLRGMVGWPRRNRKAWLDVYADIDDPHRFRAWLEMIHDPRFRADVGDGFAQQALADFAGLFTYRYLKICCSGKMDRLGSHEALRDFDERHCYVDSFIRVERLPDSLLEMLEAAGFELPAGKVAAMRAARRTNASSRTRDSQFYYDAASALLVGQRDRLIADKFSYTAPGPGQ